MKNDKALGVPGAGVGNGLLCPAGVTYGATTSVDLNQNYLFRTRTNAFSFGTGETAT